MWYIFERKKCFRTECRSIHRIESNPEMNEIVVKLTNNKTTMIYFGDAELAPNRSIDICQLHCHIPVQSAFRGSRKVGDYAWQ